MSRKVGSWQLVVGSWWGIALGLIVLCAGQPSIAAEPLVADQGQDFVFLGESRPVLVRLHVRIDGKPLQTAWDECIDYLFKYLDGNGDGVLSKEEVERGPTADQFTGGGTGGGFGAFGRGAPASLKMDAVDAERNGKVTRADLAAYYRRSGFTPFQFNFGSGQNPISAFSVLYSGSRPEPSVEDVNKAIFALLDTSNDGKLTRKQLAAAEQVLLKMDENEDEIVTPREIAPNTVANVNPFAMFALGGPGGRNKATSSPLLVPILTPGEAPADFVSRMMDRYGAEAKDNKLTRKELGLDEVDVRKLDTNSDGLLDGRELTRFVKRSPDVELVLRLGKKKDAEARQEVVTGDGRSPLAKKFTPALGLLDLGLTRAELRPYDPDGYGQPNRSVLMRQDYLIQFRQADVNSDAIVDATEAKGNQRLNRLFRMMDYDGDGTVTEKELGAYFDHLQALEQRVAAGSVSFAISDQSRGLFDLLDTNRDSRLSVREARQAANLLKQLDRSNKGHLTRDDLPKTYRMELRRASFSLGDGGGLALVADLYSGAYEPGEAEQTGKGPLWFRRMDRNRDGDVSRKEWLFTEEQFRTADTDGDGLISVAEAEKANK